MDQNIPTESISFILSHFKGQEFLFPRSIMTSKTNGQIFIDSESQMLEFFEKSNYIDCRINAYPLHHKDESHDLYPSFIFIDLDLLLCTTCKYPIKKLDYILKQTLKKLSEEIKGHPTVLWTGSGYHIYQPIKIVTKNEEKQPLETFKEFEEFVPIIRNDLCTEFIRFSTKYLTNDKGDPKHNPSIYSCLIRIPGTINSKYNEKVRIVQEWNGIEANANPMVIPFLDHLIQTKIEANKELRNREFDTKSAGNNKKIAWIEKLLQTPISDHRYYCLWHILIPYLKNIKGLPDHEVIYILTEWLNKCNNMNKVRWRYPQKIREQLIHDGGYPPISLGNLKKENIELYQMLQDR